MKIDIVTMKLPELKIKDRDISKLRGYLGNKFIEFQDMHNHEENGVKYGYPMMQYKIIEDTPSIIGIGESGTTLMKIAGDIDEVNINGVTTTIEEKLITMDKVNFEATEDMQLYRFISPWMCLNQKNYDDYMKGNETEKHNILKRILIGNLISMSKGLGYTVDKQLQAISRLEPIEVNFKNQKMLAFKGEFLVNFLIPDYLGLGKSVARGFGVVERI